MKKLFFVSIFILVTSGLFAQLKLYNSGAISIGAIQDPGSEKTVFHDDVDFLNPIFFNETTEFDEEASFNSGIDANGTIFLNNYPTSNSVYFGSSVWFNPVYYNARVTFNLPLDVFNNIYLYGSIITPSDEILKTNIRDLDQSSLDRITKLRGVTYEYIGDEENTLRTGFLAQEVQKIFPELVTNENDTLGIKTIELIPHLVEAIKEQQVLIEELQNELAGTKKSEFNSLSSSTEGEQFSSTPLLYQNSPNPFSENTIIKYYLPETAITAFINIYNLNGKQLKSRPLISFGESQIILSGGEFEAGMYMYTLISDGKVIDTKTMILID